jgi:hypothetical protein
MDSSPSPTGGGVNSPAVGRSPRHANVAAGGRGVAAGGRGVAVAGRGLAGGQIAAAAARQQAACGRGNACGAGRCFTIAELENLNEVISQVLPIGGAEWDEVANLHAQQYPSISVTL